MMIVIGTLPFAVGYFLTKYLRVVSDRDSRKSSVGFSQRHTLITNVGMFFWH